MKTQDGFLHSFKKGDSITGSRMPRIGASQETDTGVTQSQSGLQRIWKSWFALAQSKNYKNFQDVVKSQIFTEKTLITLLFHQRWVRVFLEESPKFSIVGSKVVLCHSLNAIIHSLLLQSNSKRDSQQTLLLKVLIKPEVGSIL